MDLLSQHEAFLRAIFDAPDDDTPRLVYADFLQEHGEEERATLIRWQCGRGAKPATVTSAPPKSWRGFPPPPAELDLRLERLLDTNTLRGDIVRLSPEFFAATTVRLFGGRIASAEPFDVLFGLAAFALVTELELIGEEVPDLDSDFTTFSLVPVITPAGVAALAQHRSLRRITTLDLRNNDLDNDAARALVKSPYLDNLKRLRLLEGNRLRGRVWQQVIERFGEDVVG
ncbi:hypothetical protein VT84_27765 [Gemmata sp. SH-PL17]|uniref:TIGR02996 domain-containing protein n=1 Tax=Gemmata sp. SH-PL17 TaxID=1630693 RepID=UPI00078BD94C|nr:TIGR02996 domain-containing protein [Gemmata sp. SH-PL17]AMV28236.1 hypothetical protein VT84_27765 [Gemmata sp. SH-PL17]